MKKYFLFFIFFNLFSVISAQTETEKIKWQENRPLTWEDFKASPDRSSSFSANTNSGISYSWNYSTSSGKPILTYEVFANFYPGKSWVKKIQNEAYLLAHEQLHFDISELHARKLRQALHNYEIGRNIRQDLKRIYTLIENQRVAMQQQCDRETSHSENKKAEMKWQEYIQAELKKMDSFSG